MAPALRYLRANGDNSEFHTARAEPDEAFRQAQSERWSRGYFFGGLMGLIFPQSADSHLPEASMVIFSGLPLTVLVVFIFMV